MKRVYLSFLLFLSVIVSFAEIKTGKCGENLTYTLDTETGLLKIEGSGKMYDWNYGYIGPWGKNITEVDLPDGLLCIGEYAFHGCSSLTSIEIPNSVTSIGYEAFSGCSSLTTVNIPSSVTSIGRSAFSNCSSLPIIDGLRYADTYLVGAVDKQITSCSIKEGTRFIGDSAFRSCTGLSSITIPNSVTSIGYEAFKNCSSLTTVNIPNSVTSIGFSAFQNCSSLPIIDGLRYADTYLVGAVDKQITSCSIKEGTRFIGDAAINGCKNITSVSIPNSVTSIGEMAFALCSSLNSVYIPNSVTSIGRSAFGSCTSLTSLSIPNSVTSIGETAFRGCSSLTSVSIPNSVTSIGANAFGDCTSLISIEIPNSVTDFAFDAFSGCSGLTSIIIGRYVTSIYLSTCSSLKNVVFNAVQCTSVSFPGTVEVLYIGADVTTIPDKAFSACTDLTDVYCYAPEPFKILDTTFKVYENLHVLPGCGELYAQKDPWKRFTIKEDLEEPFDPDAQQCATPTVVYADGELIFECATNGATIKSEVTSEDVQKYTTDRIPLSATYTITAYAVKDGMNNSEKITATLHWLDGTLDADGVNATFASKRAVMVCASAGTVTVSGLEDGEAVELYTTSGRKLADTRANGNTAILSAKAGEVVIVKIAGQNMKVLSR